MEASLTAPGPELSRSLVDFIHESPTSFHAVHAISSRLAEAGFRRLGECERWDLRRGGRYYVVRNDSSVVGFRIGREVRDPSFTIALAHTDSPTLRLKPSFELEGPCGYVRVDVEPYGGLIDRTWLDRPLTVGGRVFVREGSRIERRLVCPDADLLIIPSLAIHMKRDVNTDGAIDRTHDIYPVFSAGGLRPGALARVLAHEAGAEPDQVLSADLMLVNRQRGVVWGAAEEFVSAPRIDDLQCAFGALTAFLGHDDNPSAVTVLACLDNEEVGSSTMQGALSTFVSETLERVDSALDPSREAHHTALARSFVVSADNAQAVHPNHPELSDELNRPRLNGGVVVKVAARQTYATDAFSRAVFAAVCADAGVPVQTYANRSDMPGGSTMGNLLLRGAGIHTVDVGLAQLAMHSSFETAGALDTGHFARAMRALFEARIRYLPDGAIEVG